MPKIRTVKPDLFRHERLFEAEQRYALPLRLAFAGLFTCCDREGRFRWRPRQLKLDILPYDEVDFSAILNALHTEEFIKRYQSESEVYGYVPSWHRHQTINAREPQSRLPDPKSCQHFPAKESNSECSEHAAHVQAHASQAHASETQMPAHLEVEMEGNRKGSGSGACADVSGDSTHVAPASSLILIPLQDKTEFIVTTMMIEEWQNLYPAVNILQALRHIRAWNIANPKRRKTQQGILKHITSWLIKEQNKCSGNSRSPPHAISFSRSTALQTHNLSIAEDWLLQSNSYHTMKEEEIYDT